ncbi:unnamed protein product [Staurois parvus]|uniref:Uncharacterized protein n=1 Tax=Staurois parvus TaxID=386267 RepID=A0ABN9EB95_9NEOB|nr:unnamed protein product [Staurois parvus]
MNGPVVFWGLSCVPKDYREEGGGHQKRSQWKWEWVTVKSGYSSPPPPPAPQMCQSLMRSRGPIFKVELPLLGGTPL